MTIVILFSTPDMSDFGKYVYIFVTYVLLSGVFMTFLNTQDSTYLRRSLRGGSRISKVLSRKGVLQMLLSGLGHAALPQLIVLWGEEPGGWTKITLVYAIPVALFLIGYLAAFALGAGVGVQYAAAGIGFVLGILFAIRYDRRLRARGGLSFTIVRLF